MKLAVVAILATFAALAAGQCPGRIHDSFGGSNYYYSWRDGRPHTTSGQASNICRSLCMDLVSMESTAENNFVRQVISRERQQFIWTSGRRAGNGWVWGTGVPFPPRNQAAWSRTGGGGRPQPDNREGNEVCMAVLNNFYSDGVVWHDVGCSHPKPFICEARGGAGGAVNNGGGGRPFAGRGVRGGQRFNRFRG